MSHAAHRILWTVIGLLLTAIGGFGLAANLGYLPGTDVHAPLLWSGLLGLWRNTAPWGLVVVIAVGLLLGLLGLVLLRRVPPARLGGDIDELIVPYPTAADSAPVGRDAFDPERRADRLGLTRVRGVVLIEGLERDLARDPQVRRASVALVGYAPRPELRIQLYVDPCAQLAAVRDHVSVAVDRFATTSGLHPRRLDVTARIDAASRRRVR
jgi:hypothetical protein